MVHLSRGSLAVCLLALAPLAASAESIRYQPVVLNYVLKPRMPVPAGAATYSIQGAVPLELVADRVVVGGLTRVPTNGDVQLSLSGSAPQVGPARHQSFDSEVHVVVQNRSVPPQYRMTVRWATVPVAQKATLTVSAGNVRREYDVGAEVLHDVGPKPETSSGFFQVSGSQWTLMQSEPAATAEAAVNRAKWVGENFCADVATLAGWPQLQTSDGRGMACVKAKIPEASSPSSLERLRTKVVERTNAVLEQEIASGQRRITRHIPIVEGDSRFEQALQALRGAADDRYQTAAVALRPAVADPSVSPRVRAAALYGMALCQLGQQDLAAANASLAMSKETNAQESDGFFGSSGKDLARQIDALQKLVTELLAREGTGPAPSVSRPQAEPPRPATPPGPAADAAPATPVVPKPWARMNDDEFMAAYPGLVQAASTGKDTAELQKLGMRMAEVMLRRSGQKP